MIFYNKSGKKIGEIIYGDCLEILPTITETVEICVTSPPYNIIPTIGQKGLQKKLSWYNDNLAEPDYQNNQKQVIRLLRRLCTSSIFYNHKVRYAWHARNKFRGKSKIYHPMQWLNEFPIWSEIIWDRMKSNQPIQKRLTTFDERIYQIGKPKKFNNNYNIGNIWRIAPTKNVEHPCSFPIALPGKCILLCTDEDDLVVDPYLGSGTTALAAIKHNRRFIGIEQNKEYYDLACKSVTQELNKYQQISINFG